MLKICDINHVSLSVKDLAAAKRFYCDTLGMTDLPRPADLELTGAWLRSGSAEIHLFVEESATHASCDLSCTRTGEPNVGIDSARHFSLVINDTAALTERLAAAGVSIAFGPIARFGSLVQTYCYDPDGHLVEFTQLPEDTNRNQSKAGSSRPISCWDSIYDGVS